MNFGKVNEISYTNRYTCVECGKTITLQKKLDVDRPIYCRECHEKHRAEHTAICSTCGETCIVPFIPEEGRPVFCYDCYKAMQEKRVADSSFNRAIERRKG